VTITFKLEGHKNRAFLHLLLGISHIYCSVSYIDFSLHVNQDREMDSGVELCCSCSRMKERERRRR